MKMSITEGERYPDYGLHEPFGGQREVVVDVDQGLIDEYNEILEKYRLMQRKLRRLRENVQKC